MIDKLIEKYSKPGVLQISGTDISIVETEKVKSDLLELKESLIIEHSHKPIVPQIAAARFEYCKNKGFTLWASLNPRNEMEKEMKIWLNDSDNQTLYAQMWIAGDYEVEEEPKYYVETSTGYLSFVSCSVDKAFEVETSKYFSDAIMFPKEAQAMHLAKIVGGNFLQIEKEVSEI